jgi:hypothetical protein
MIVPEALQNFLSKAKDISLGYREINFCDLDNLEEEQEGYNADPSDKPYTEFNEGGWRESWLVIASDDLGDPIFIDIATSALTVLSAEHGMGTWTPIVIADSLDNFQLIITKLKTLSKGRTTPVSFERRPISDQERTAFLTFIKATSSLIDVSYWSSFIEDE